uniref:Zinc ribbon domain-containing protein n=1 Tax=candidate division WOR-3 bacterium TaxID=2052148 RepID=A0A7C4XG65_UNCW3
MPIIEFSCKRCGHKFEELIFKEGELSAIRCPKCSSKDLERLFSVFGFASKGSDKSSSSNSSCTTCSRTTCAGCKP